MNLNYILENDLLRVSLWNLGLEDVLRLRRRIGGLRKTFGERFEFREDLGERASPRNGFHDQAVVFLMEDDLITRKLQFARNSKSLIAPVAEQSGATRRLRLRVTSTSWHMPSISQRHA